MADDRWEGRLWRKNKKQAAGEDLLEKAKRTQINNKVSEKKEVQEDKWRT
jgi:hypothetical protein